MLRSSGVRVGGPNCMVPQLPGWGLCPPPLAPCSAVDVCATAWRTTHSTTLIFIKTSLLNANTHTHTCNTFKLENVAINDVLPLKAARCDAIANLKCFRASNTRDLISMVTFIFTMRRHLIRLASTPFISSSLATFGWVRFPCATRAKYNAELTKGG